MPNVQFTDENTTSRYQSLQNNSQESAMIKMVIKIGLAKDKSGANVVLVVISIICLATAAYLFF